ncbi:uncharacterized protein LOC118197241 [Stegodyphus dumicola]|uniref:uncharacterized protein LOC118197241 n=1 Tax=Stegodyphus dumicola TaxID=202533 RepID=UPI0015A7A300|nr:uncharacterized protein LOC118197241 [Stegodyphus dumicola]
MMAVSLVILSRKPTLLPFHAVKKTSCHPVRRKYKDKIEKRKHRLWKWQVIQGSVFYKTLQAASVNEILLFMLKKYWCCFHKDIISNFYFCLNIWNSKNKKNQNFIHHILSSHSNIKTGNLKTSEDYILHNSSCNCYSKISATESNTVTYKLMSPYHYKCNCLLSECHICKDFFHKHSDKVHKSSQVKRKQSNSFDQETVTINSVEFHVPDISPNKANSDELDWKKLEQLCSKTWSTFLVTDPAFSSKKRKLDVSSVESASPMSSHHHILKSGDSHHNLAIQHNSVSQTSKTNSGVFHYAESDQATIDSCQVLFASAEDQEIHHHSLKSGDYHTQSLQIPSHSHSNSASQILVTEKCVSSLESDETSVNTDKISVAPEDPRLHFYRNHKQKDGISLKRVKWSFCHNNRTNSNCGYAYSKNSPEKKQVQQLCINGYSLQDPRLTRGVTAKHFQKVSSTASYIQHEIKFPFHVSELENKSSHKSNTPTKYMHKQVCRLENENRYVNQIEKYKEKSKETRNLSDVILSEQNKDLIEHELGSEISVEHYHLKGEIKSDRKLQCESVSPSSKKADVKKDFSNLINGYQKEHPTNKMMQSVDEASDGKSKPKNSLKKSKCIRARSFKKNFQNRNSLLASSSAISTDESVTVEQQAAENAEVSKETILAILINVAKNETASAAVSNISSNSLLKLNLKSNSACSSELQGMSVSSVSNSSRKHDIKEMSDVLRLGITSPIPVITESKGISPNQMQTLLQIESASPKCDTEDLAVSFASVHAVNSDEGIDQKLESVPLFESYEQKSSSVSQSPLVNSVIPNETDLKEVAPNSVGRECISKMSTNPQIESASPKCDTEDLAVSSASVYAVNLDGGIDQKLESVPLFESYEQKSSSVSRSPLVNSVIPNAADVKKVESNYVGKHFPSVGTEDSTSLKCDVKDVSCSSENAANMNRQIFQKLESVPLFESHEQKSKYVSQSAFVNSVIPNATDMKKVAPNSKHFPSIDIEESTSLKCDFKDMSYSSENADNLDSEIFHKLESDPLFESHKQKSNSVSQSLLINSVIPSEADIKKIALNSVAKVFDTEESVSLKCDTKSDNCASHSSNLGGQIFEKFKSVPLFESDKQKLNSVSQSTVINSVTANEADIKKLASDCVAKLLPSVGFDTECIPVNEITDSLAKLAFITPDSQELHVSNNVTGIKITQSDTNIDSENVNIKSNANKRLLIFKSDCSDLHSSNTYSEKTNKNIMLSVDIFEENGALDRYYKHLSGMGFHTLDLSHITKDVTLLDGKSLESFYFLREQLHYHESVLRGLVHQASEPGTDCGWEIARKITEELEYIEGYEVACTVMFL